MVVRKPRAKAFNRIFSAGVALAIALILVLLQQIACPASAAPIQQQQVVIAISKNAYWYRPGDKVLLQLTLENLTRQTLKSISTRVRIHTPNSTRSDLDACLEGKPAKSYRQTDTFSNLTLSPGNNYFNFELLLKTSRFTAGVYPMTVEVLRGGNVTSNAFSELVVVPVDEAEQLTPLKLSWIFDTLEPPHRDPAGLFRSNELAAECDTTGENPGWFPTLLTAMDKWQEMSFNLILSPMLLEDMRVMSKGYTVREGDRERKVAENTLEASNAGVVIGNLRALSQSPRYQLIPGPYASPDLEELVSLNWTEDARQQLSRGHKLLEEILETTLSRDYACPPGLNVNSKVIDELDGQLARSLVLSTSLLERSRDGRKLTSGLTLGSTVPIEGNNNGTRRVAVFADSRMQELLKRLCASGDSHGIAQCILAELTNLYLERPSKQRACVVVAPSFWHPSKEVLEEVMRALNSAPWIRTATLAENMATVPTVSETPLMIPQSDQNREPDEYFQQVARARSDFLAYHSVVLPGNPVLAQLQRNVYFSESDVWRQWEDLSEGLSYADFVTSSIAGELSKVEMPAEGSITLTSVKAKIPLSVVNNAGYRIKAVLKLASNGLSFPSGSEQKVLLEPKENLLEIPVVVKKKGRVKFSARLAAGGFALGEVDFSVLTSRFNTFAIVLVGGLLALIGLIWIVKIYSRRKVGKHKKYQLQEANRENGTRQET